MLVERTREDLLEDIRLLGLYPEVSEADLPVDEAGCSLCYSIRSDEGIYLGYCMLYQIDVGTVWAGIRIMNKPYWDKGYGTESLNTLAELTRLLNIPRLRSRVLATNHRAIRCNQKCGFVEYGKEVLDDHEYILMERILE